MTSEAERGTSGPAAINTGKAGRTVPSGRDRWLCADAPKADPGAKRS